MASAGVPACRPAPRYNRYRSGPQYSCSSAPNRRPSATVAAALHEGGFDVAGLRLERAEGGRSQLYSANAADGQRAFVKVFGRDSRDADLLYRGYRALVLRGPNDGWPSPSLKLDVEHEALLLLLAGQGGVACPAVEALTSLDSGSMVLALGYVDGRHLDELASEELDDRLLDATWEQVVKLHKRRIAHRALRAANVLVGSAGPVVIDLGFGDESATERMFAIDRAELLTSLAAVVGPERSVASAARMLGSHELATAMPYLQPLALSAATRKQVSKSGLAEVRALVASTSGEEPAPLERLVRVRPRTLVMIAALTGAFYVLLPQLANVGDSLQALGHANWAWLVVCVLMSLPPTWRGDRDNGSVVSISLRTQPRTAVRLVVRESGLSGQRRRHGTNVRFESGRVDAGPDRCGPELHAVATSTSCCSSVLRLGGASGGPGFVIGRHQGAGRDSDRACDRRSVL
jgi:undecaprenyl-diphosphatase